MQDFLDNANIAAILMIIAVSLFILAKSSDKLVDNAVVLASTWGISEIIIGATVVSLGTTLPELVSSVIAALKGTVGFALGNAVGSIITNTGFVLGFGVFFGSISIKKESIQKFNILIFALTVLLIPTVFTKIGNKEGLLHQPLGFVLLLMVPVYILTQMKYQKKPSKNKNKNNTNMRYGSTNKKTYLLLSSILTLAVAVSFSASALVASSVSLAKRLNISELIISSTIVAFGTSVPELSTTINALKKGYGELSLGNILGADILNVLLVLGATISVSKNGMPVPANFYSLHIFSLILVLCAFAFFVYNDRCKKLTKKEGAILIFIYLIFLFGNIKNIL